jgi:DMSO/TMAO reductase YedYZ molybdopterin-dependent catalytic subunit
MAGSGQAPGSPSSFDDVDIRLAGRNRSLPIEALRYDVTPTGMHYLLNHFDIPEAQEAAWRLRVDGLVERPLDLVLDELRALPATTIAVTLECAGNGRTLLSPRPRNQPWGLEAVATAEWTGVPLRDVLDAAGVRADAVELVFSGADHGTQGGVEHDYQRSLSVAEARRPEVLLVHAMNGRPLEPQHGAPLRLIVPGWYGMASVKWLTRIEAVGEPFLGYQQARSYNIRQAPEDAGVRITRMRVRALMIPPGHAEFPSLRRLASPGLLTVRGRAWSGAAPISRVEVSIDGGPWVESQLDAPVGEFAWTGWRHEWQATPGEHELRCRATDATGETQPLEQAWNLGGYCNNMVQTVRVTVA